MTYRRRDQLLDSGRILVLIMDPMLPTNVGRSLLKGEEISWYRQRVFFVRESRKREKLEARDFEIQSIQGDGVDSGE